MTQATIGNIFPVKTEQVNLEPVMLLDWGSYGNGVHNFTESLLGFEYVEYYMGVGAESRVYDVSIVPQSLMSTYALNDAICNLSYAQGGVNYSARVSYTSPTSITVSDISSNNAKIIAVIGYRRRISQTGLDEILSVIAQPNLFINTWHNSPKVVNQRAFNGDWSALTIGDYGFDMWLKTSATHKGFIIEAGSYIPGATYIVQADGIIKGTVTAPLDGGHWLHSFPFASDKFDIRLGSVKVPWHPETDERLEDCLRYYETVPIRLDGMVHGPNGEFRTPFYKFKRNKRIVPSTPNANVISMTILAFASSGNGVNLACSAENLIVNTQGFNYGFLGNYNNVASILGASGGNFQVSDNGIKYPIFDATIALTDVANDPEHRVVWG